MYPKTKNDFKGTLENGHFYLVLLPKELNYDYDSGDGLMQLKYFELQILESTELKNFLIANTSAIVLWAKQIPYKQKVDIELIEEK